jgi:hypothetical protein
MFVFLERRRFRMGRELDFEDMDLLPAQVPWYLHDPEGEEEDVEVEAAIGAEARRLR